MSHGPWCTREDEAGDFSRWGFWFFSHPVFHCPPCFTKVPRVPGQAARCQLPRALGWLSEEQDEPHPHMAEPRGGTGGSGGDYCPGMLCWAHGRSSGTGTRKGVQSHDVLWDGGAGTIWKSFFAGRARTKGDGRRDAMTTFGGFPGNHGRHGNCITPVGISDFRWKACSPL